VRSASGPGPGDDQIVPASIQSPRSDGDPAPESRVVGDERDYFRDPATDEIEDLDVRAAARPGAGDDLGAPLAEDAA